MKNGCFCAKGQKYQKKIIGFPIIQHYIIIAFDKKCNKNFLSFILASHLVFTDIVSPVDEPRLASPGVVVSCIFFYSQSIPREEAAGRPGPIHTVTSKW